MNKRIVQILLGVFVIFQLYSFTQPYPFVSYSLNIHTNIYIGSFVQLQSDDKSFSHADTFGVASNDNKSSFRIVCREKSCRKYQKLVIRSHSERFESEIFEYKQRLAFIVNIDNSGISLSPTNKFEIINWIKGVAILFCLGLMLRGFITFLFYRSRIQFIILPFALLNLLFSLLQFSFFKWMNDINNIHIAVLMALVILTLFEYYYYRQAVKGRVGFLRIILAIAIGNLCWYFAGWIIMVLIMFWII